MTFKMPTSMFIFSICFFWMIVGIVGVFISFLHLRAQACPVFVIVRGCQTNEGT